MSIVKVKFILGCRVDELFIKRNGKRVKISVKTNDIIDIDLDYALSIPAFYQVIKTPQAHDATSVVESHSTVTGAVSTSRLVGSSPLGKTLIEVFDEQDRKKEPDDQWPHPDDFKSWVKRDSFDYVRATIKAELGFSGRSVKSLHERYRGWYNGQ